MRTDIQSKLMQDGVVLLEGFLTKGEADELRQAGEELQKNRSEDKDCYFSTLDNKKYQLSDEYFLTSNDKIHYFLENLEDNAPPTLNKVGHALHLLHPMFKFYTFSSRVKEICYELGMRDPTVVQSMYIYKNAGNGTLVAPHQDSTYLSTDPETAIGFWIALEDATLENGCLWFAKGSHKSGVHRRLMRNPEKSSHMLLIYDRPQPLYPSSNFTPMIVSKGDCILIHGQVVHKSNANKSEIGRPAYTFHVVEKSAKYSPDNWLQEGPAAPFHSLYTTSQTD